MYIGHYQDSRNNVLRVVERINGKRVYEDFPLVLEYYIPDKDGYYLGYDGQRLKKIEVANMHELKAHKDLAEDQHLKTYELNFNIPNKVLYKHFKQGEFPTLHKSFVDIEVDRAGFEYLTVKQLIKNACCPINAISIYNDWMETLFTLMLKPETITKDEALEICAKFDNTYLFDREEDLLNCIIALLEDTDVFAGWNSTNFDTPYIVRRIEKVLGKNQTKRLCAWDIEPREKEKESKFGDLNINYEIYGKWFTDYMELYIKHEQGKKESYSLNSIAEIEIGEEKVQHDESLEDMYRNHYEDFIKYNRQDTMLVKKLDDKLKYIDIHNRQAHDIRCSLEQTMGTVGWVDQAIINEAHDQNLMIPDRVDGKNDEFKGIIPPGAFVPVPKKGLCQYIMSYDMNSLYPTTMRSINLSPETIVAQVQMTKTIPHMWEKIRTNNMYKNLSKQIPDWGAVWAGDDMWGTLEYQDILNQTDDVLEVKFEDTGDVAQATAKELHDMIFADDSNLSISAAGTIFRTDKKGLLNQIFTRWYAERKQFKKLKEKYANLYDGVKIEDEGLLESIRGANITCDTTGNNIEYDLDELKRLVEEKNVSEIIEFMKKNNLVLADNIIESVDKNYFKDQKEFYNLEQYVKKIQLNSSYGALLNTSSVFYDFRLGSSTTLSGRKVWQNLSASANKAIIGKYEANGEAQKYGDTDSVYMSLDCDAFRQTHPNFDYSRDHLVEFADDVAKQINAGFPEYMKKTFHCTDEGANLQAAGREVVASRGVFVSKKRYALMKFDEDGHRLDTHGKDGKIKIMGLQVQRSDCPKLVRDMLKKMLESLLTKGSKEELMGILKKFGNTDWKKLKPWQKGTPKACNKLTSYTNQFNESGQCSVGQVMAAINWNHLIDLYQDKKTPKILDGNKIIVCKLKKNNSLNMSSVAYPVDMTVFPKWFKQLPFDEQSMKESVVEKTVESIFGVLDWDLSLEKAMNDHGDLDGLLTFV